MIAAVQVRGDGHRQDSLCKTDGQEPSASLNRIWMDFGG